jgi:hypothetical protein
LTLLNESEATLVATGVESLLGYVRARRALALTRLGRPADALPELELAELDSTRRTRTICEFARARLLLERGDGRGAIEASGRVDALTREHEKFVNLRVEALIEIATVRFGVGDVSLAIDAATSAEEMAGRKGNLALQRRAREDLARFGSPIV